MARRRYKAEEIIGKRFDGLTAPSEVEGLRDELLDREVFDTLLEAKVLVERWRQHYNRVRPHSALDWRTPGAYAASLAAPPVGAAPSLRSIQRTKHN